jgi:GDSL-like Lipase/Acylhydrolase
MNPLTRKALSRALASILFILGSTLWLSAQIHKSVNFSNLVVVGDSLAAGVENGSLEDVQQTHGFANVIAQQVGTNLVLPMVPPPGAPNTLELLNPGGFPPVIAQDPSTPLALFPVPNVRENPNQQATDLAVPLQTVAQALTLAPSLTPTLDETQLATDIVLGFPCPFTGSSCTPLTQVQQAVALHPTTIIIDIGNNDILGAVTSGQLSTMVSSPAAFFVSFNKSYGSLMTALAATKATLVVANIPDVTEAPYFIPVWKLAQEANIPLLEVTRALGLGPFEYVTLDALPAIEAILQNASGPLPLFCVPGSPSTPCYLTLAEAAEVRLVTVGLNVIIALQAAAHGAVVVDLFSLVDNLHANGYRIGSAKLTTDFLGGLFSLDGLHPTNTGYAIMANQFIQTMNTAFKSKIPLANVPEVAATDPLLP